MNSILAATGRTIRRATPTTRTGWAIVWLMGSAALIWGVIWRVTQPAGSSTTPAVRANPGDASDDQPNHVS